MVGPYWTGVHSNDEYRVNPAAVAALRDQLDTFWSRALAGYTDVVDEPGSEET